MITNEKQYRTTKKQLNSLRQALELSKQTQGKMKPRIYQAMLEGMGAQITDLEQELQEYESLKKLQEVVLESISELPLALIKIRIMKGLSQKQLAELAHLKQQQIQRYEANFYQGISFDKLVEICRALGVEIDQIKIKVPY